MFVVVGIEHHNVGTCISLTQKFVDVVNVFLAMHQAD